MEAIFTKKEKKRLTPVTTVLMTLMFSLITVVVARAIYFIVTGA